MSDLIQCLRPAPNPMRDLIARACNWREAPEAFLEVLRVDASVSVIGDRRDSPIYGVHRGRERILELTRLIDQELTGNAAKNLNIIVDGDRFAVRRANQVRHRGSAQTAHFMTGFIAHASLGQIDDLVFYVDTALLRRLMSL